MGRGTTRPLDTLDPSSERAFLRKRRLQVEAGSGDLNVDAAAIPLDRVVGQEGWEESHDREVQFHNAKTVLPTAGGPLRRNAPRQ